jgi:hypothetical protein
MMVVMGERTLGCYRCTTIAYVASRSSVYKHVAAVKGDNDPLLKRRVIEVNFEFWFLDPLLL